MLSKPEHIAYRDELVAGRRACYHESQRDSLTLRDLLRNQCNWFAKKFAEKFPDLKEQPGFYDGQEHIWCKDSEGNIVDPTYEQFLPGGLYEEYDEEKHEVYLHTCPNCGSGVYGLKKEAGKFGGMCSDECGDSYAAYITAEASRW